MTTFATRFRAAFDSDALPTMDASMTPRAAAPLDATMDASLTPRAPATLQDASRPAIVDPSMGGATVDDVRYDVKSVLGRGGMGEVRLCHDARIGRDVAIKVAHTVREKDGSERVDDPTNRSVRARFLREARVQGQLEHPAIVPVYDLEVFADGSAYFAMKRVRGTTLAAVLAALAHGDDEAARTFPLRKLLAAFQSVCLAVDFAHTKGVLHRDIKPGNIMLGDFGEVYLLDWGLAKVLHDDTPDTATAVPHDVAGATQAGSVLGTPGYMAPEQIDPSLGEVGPAADVYALGAVLFEMVARARYIEAKDAIEATLLTLQGAERRPSRRAPAALAATIAPALDELCARALARSPAERFASARALHDAVDAFLAGEHDLERRRALSAAHLAAASRHASDDGRAAALKELGSALALDPENADARRALVRLLTSSPSRVPAEVERRVEDDAAERIRAIARLRTWSGVAFVPFVPFAMWLGVKEPIAFALSLAAIGVTSALNAWIARCERPYPWLQVAAHATFLVATLGFSRIAGPFLLVPALLLAYAVELQMHPRASQRLGALAACCVTVVLAFALERSGWVTPSYTIVDEGILVHARMLALPGAALWFLAAAAIATIVTPSMFASRVRATLADAEAKLHMQSWQLAQIVPQDAPAAPTSTAGAQGR